MKFSLEERLNVKESIDRLENIFDEFCNDNAGRVKPESRLKAIKDFLYERWSAYRTILKGTILDSKDCTALTALASMLAARKGIITRVASPRRLSSFLHTTLVYSRDGEERVYEITSTKRYPGYRCLGLNEIRQRLLYIKYFLPILCLLRPNNHLKYLR